MSTKQVIYEHNFEYARKQILETIKKMQDAAARKDHKTFYRAEAEFNAAMKLLDEAEAYHKQYLEGCP